MVSRIPQQIPKLFGTSGIRGKLSEDITLELAVNVGRAVSTYVKEFKQEKSNTHGEPEGLSHGKEAKCKIVVGYDTRTSSEMLENAVVSGILQGGCDVLRLGMAPTPLVGYAAMKLCADAGIMITASHNPPQYNGIKLWNPDGMAYRQNQERNIEKIIHEKSFIKVSWENIGKIGDIKGITSDYINDLVDNADIKPGVKVVVDCANGAASYISPLVLRKAGCSVVTLNSQPDGFFPGRMPEPSPQNLQELMKVVKATGADIGIAHDGDADRMVAIDENGHMADFDKLLALVSRAIGGKVVTTVDASVCTDRCMDEVGGEVIRTKVGDVHVAEAIAKNHASFGGEPSGTWLHPNFCMCPDGILSALRVIEIVQKHGPLSKLLDKIPSYPTIRDKINCENFQKPMIMKGVEEKLPDMFDGVIDVNRIDGVRISMNDNSWVLIRPSGTEAYIRITLEAADEERARAIRDKCAEFIEGFL
ncbi:phosphoglucosamine mutase [Methanobacterium paludis]|uniref:Probable phosphoglucosamine mutase n=1 Tax=Methanobacterium paludis (strain DSM 25820 / JCM 18151 / SWAN1) TaxID=868131 RepID=F6D339_METPW|nr:phosphoglucosamine mutase [Methanobacterium paludis]AEG17402.1 Phosphoglucosamine mutase [Methanobacterium paludis]